SVSGAFSRFTGSPQGGMATPGNTNSTVLQLAEDISWARGNHQFGFGANFIHGITNYVSATQTPGLYNFNTTNTGLSMGDFFLGRPNQFRQSQYTGWYPR